MNKIFIKRNQSLFFAILFLFNTNTFSNDEDVREIIGNVSKIYMSSMIYIFKSQSLINQKGGDKQELFGQKFVDNIKIIYKNKYEQGFPLESHLTVKMLLRSMIEVMEDYRELIRDDEIGFKGIIPATFAFQLSMKLSTKGIGLKIKFTRTEDELRNKLNMPDGWEVMVMEKIKKEPKIYFDQNAVLNGKPAFRQFTPLPMAEFCLACHGKPENNPLNRGKKKSQWTNIDMTGFKMENWTMDSFGGGVSISIEKSAFN